MKDRVVQYPNRYKLTLVSGTTDTYDLEAVPGTVTAAGTDLNKASLLADATATALGLSGDPTVNDALMQTQANVAGWDLLTSYVEAGTYIYTIPDLFDGKAYKLGVCVIAGGGSGALSTSNYGAYGGCSGELHNGFYLVTPGETANIIVGAGGASIAGAAADGNNGGSSSITYDSVAIVSLGGSGGVRKGSNVYAYISGRVGGRISVPPTGGTNISPVRCGTVDLSGAMGSVSFVPNSAESSLRQQNIFDGKYILLPGGFAHYNGSGEGDYPQTVDDDDMGNSGSSGVSGRVRAAVALAGTSYGCGGGSVAVGSSYAATSASAAGADGAVLLYVWRV